MEKIYTPKPLFNSLIIDYKEYYIISYNNIFKIIIRKNENEIIIKCRNYMISFNLNDFFLLSKIKFDSINSLYNYISKLFEDNNFLIKNILKNKQRH